MQRLFSQRVGPAIVEASNPSWARKHTVFAAKCEGGAMDIPERRNTNCSSSQRTRCRKVGYSDLRCRCSQGDVSVANTSYASSEECYADGMKRATGASSSASKGSRDN